MRSLSAMMGLQADAAQYALDHGIGMVVVNHAAVERAGLKAMVPWLGAHEGCRKLSGYMTVFIFIII